MSLGCQLLPALDTQRAIVAEIEAEQALVAANRELITRFEKKIQSRPPSPACGARKRRIPRNDRDHNHSEYCHF